MGNNASKKKIIFLHLLANKCHSQMAVETSILQTSPFFHPLPSSLKTLLIKEVVLEIIDNISKILEIIGNISKI